MKEEKMSKEKVGIVPSSKGHIVFDAEPCTGFHVCEAVCSFEKDFGPTLEPFEGPKWRYRGWLREEE